MVLALAGVTFFLTEHLRTTSLRQNQTKAIYLAQAGVMQAIFDFRFNAGGNGFTPGMYDAIPGDAGAPGLADDNVFIIEGVPADFLLANMIPSVLGQANYRGVQNRDRLRLWRLRNVRADASIRLDFLTVSWPDPQPGVEGVVRVELGGSKVWPTSGQLSFANSGTELDISNFVIGAGTEQLGNIIYFATGGASSQMPSKAFIELRFRMSDNTIRVARYTPAVTTRSGSFTIKAVGEVREGSFPFVARRRLQAEYRLNQTNSTDIQQPGNITTDTGLLLTPPVAPADERPGYKELN